MPIESSTGEPDREWELGHMPSGTASAERGVIGTLLAFDDDGLPCVLGNAFVVYAHLASALCVCAAHSLDALRSLDRSQRRSMQHIPPNDGQWPEPEYLRPDRLRVFFTSANGREVHLCAVAQLHFQADNDLAVFVAQEVSGAHIFLGSLALSLDVPVVGETVMMVGHRLALDEPTRELSQLLEVRRGTVTSVEFARTGSGQSFVFHVSFPTLAGHSGSPVFRDLQAGQRMEVIGIVSADFSVPGSYADVRLPGRTTVSMLWPIAGLGVEARWSESEIPQLTSLLDLIRKGIIPNATRRATVTVSVKQGGTETIYADPLHGNMALKTPGDPRAVKLDRIDAESGRMSDDSASMG